MKEYELSILFHPDLEMNPDPALNKVKKMIETSGGKIVKEESEGKKRLTYSIKGNEYALYYYFTVELPSEAPSKISNALDITEEVIRHLLVSADPHRTKYLAATKAEGAKADETKAEKTEKTEKAEKTGKAEEASEGKEA